ncbi:MAG: T9SS type A sorting domain-containing protein [Candidatus Eisenbacteria bacterium]|nr:T9SS type A sorting domain-containing protein [Candidatus Eisenbacteria bacterium]
MKNTSVAVLVVALALAISASAALARIDEMPYSRVPQPTRPEMSSDDFRGAYRGTLWIFDADFSTTTGDNAGWTAYDRSGSPGQENRWHIDTVRITETYLGTQAFWCGENNICWKQPRGYGNDWYQLLSKELTGVTGTAGDAVTLEFDQRYAMEKNYDYGYVEISNDGGGDYTVLASFTNGGLKVNGLPVDWDDANGHVSYDLSSYAGDDIVLRYRFESDGLYSSQDQPDNTLHSVKDGAWELDNIQITVNGSQTFLEDCEGSDTWTHEDVTAAGQTGVYFQRGQYYVNFETGRPQACEDRDVGEWMYAGVGPSGVMVDTMDTWLVSPPIYVSGYENLVGEWDQWVDLPYDSNDRFNLFLASDDEYDCVTSLDGMVDEEAGGWYGGPFWGVWTDNWDAFAGNNWLSIGWHMYNDDADNSVPHRAGIFLNRQRVGVPEPDPSTAFNPDDWEWFHDWFKDQLSDAVMETARVQIRDQDGVASVTLMANRNDGPYEAYACSPENPSDPEWWKLPPPVNQMLESSEIHFYIEAMDDLGNVTTYPSDAPDRYFEFSILPLDATTTNPGILLVDKHKRLCPGRERDYRHTSEYYYREALGILGYEWETFDVDVESGTRDSEGPDTLGMKYYHTQIWFSHDFDSFVLWPVDQYNLIQWLQEGVTKERNLLLTGLDISYELKDAGVETLGFHDIWLSASYEGEVYGHATPSLSDTTAGVVDRAGGWTFMDYDDAECILATACPDPIESPDIIDIAAGSAPQAEVVADYKHDNCGTISPAGVAYTDATLQYQTVLLGFGVEHMMDGVCGAGASNYVNGWDYKCGLEDRVNLMGNIMGDLSKGVGYFGLTPGGTPTDVVDGGHKNALSHAYPNPFNPVTEIAFSVKEAGPVTIEVYNVAGKVVRTLLDKEFDGPVQKTVTWDGTNDRGEKCASGVYFYRINAPRFTQSRKMVMLK